MGVVACVHRMVCCKFETETSQWNASVRARWYVPLATVFLLPSRGIIVAAPTFPPQNLTLQLFRHFARDLCHRAHHFHLVAPQPHKAFNAVYMCFAAADEPLLLPSLERFKRLGIVDIAWRPEGEGNDRESKRLIRESSVFQICWSISAKVRSCMRANTRSHSRRSDMAQLKLVVSLYMPHGFCCRTQRLESNAERPAASHTHVDEARS